MPIRIRVTTGSDRTFIRDLSAEVFSVCWIGYSREIADNRFGAQGHTYFIAEDDTGPLGFAFIIAKSGASRADLQGIAVDPSRQHQGVVQGLLVAVEGHARTSGLTELDLIVAEVNTSGRNLFLRCGFVEIGPSHSCFHNGQHAVEMLKELPKIS